MKLCMRYEMDLFQNQRMSAGSVNKRKACMRSQALENPSKQTWFT